MWWGRLFVLIRFEVFQRTGKREKWDDYRLLMILLWFRWCWDMHHIQLLESGGLKEGEVISISGASVRNGELHLSSFSDLKKSTEVIEGVVTIRPVVSR